MQWYHFTLAAAAIAAAAFAWKTPRAAFWVLCLTVSFIVSVAYLYLPKPYVPNMWWPPHAGIATLCDAAVVAAVFRWGREKWETVGLRTIIMASVTVNLIQTSAYTLGFPPMLPADAHAIILEFINYLALLLIGGVGLVDRINGRAAFSRRTRADLATLGNFIHAKGWKSPPLAKW